MTVVCEGRKKYLESNEAKELLQKVMSEVSLEKGFSIVGYVLMDDHFHWMIDLSGNPAGTLTYNERAWDISGIMQSVKLRFTHRFKKSGMIKTSCVVWQRRFWDHIIRDQDDFNHHLDYIHYNPMKHGMVRFSKEYPWSSFGRYFENKFYPADWGETGVSNQIKEMSFE